MVGQREQRVLGRLPHVVQPLGRHAVAEQLVVGTCRRTAAASRGLRRWLRLLARTPGRRSPAPSRGSRRAAPRRSSGASRACGARPSRRPCRGGRRSRAAGSPRVWCTISRMSLLTRTDQKFLSFALSSLWNSGPGWPGSSCRSNAVVLTAFCSSPVRRARLSVKVSAMRNSISVRPGTPSSPRRRGG